MVIMMPNSDADTQLCCMLAVLLFMQFLRQTHGAYSVFLSIKIEGE